MPNVTFIRPELASVISRYTLIRDCISGADSIKKAGKTYLPIPNANDTSKENLTRYEAYKSRAVFYNVTRRTLFGMCGQVFTSEPIVEVPNALDSVVKDATGTGVTLSQQSYRMLSYILSYGRGGIMIDYPNTDGGSTQYEVNNGVVRPTITIHDPMSVINWRTVQIGAKTMLSLIVIAEAYPFFDDGFEIKEGCQFRVLYLDKDGNFCVELWRERTPLIWSDKKKIPSRSSFALSEGPFYPTDSNGNNFKEIPFMFVGCENNDVTVDNPPLYDLASINIAHYRNSADYEEACFVMGQPTYWFSGLTDEWLKNVLGGEIHLGSWGGVPLPQGASAGLLQMSPNTMPFEAMGHKETQMVALGAKLVEKKTVQRTATEVVQDEASETSVLSMCANNVSDAITWALQWCVRFVGNSDERAIKYRLNTDFDISKMSANDRAETIKEWQGGALTFSEMRACLRKSGVATLDDNEAKTAIDAERAQEIAAAAVAITRDNSSNLNDSGNGNV